MEIREALVTLVVVNRDMEIKEEEDWEDSMDYQD